MYSIDFINTKVATVTDCADFETQYASMLQGCDRDDIGGLTVYLRDSKVAAVWDYENECAWIV